MLHAVMAAIVVASLWVLFGDANFDERMKWAAILPMVYVTGMILLRD